MGEGFIIWWRYWEMVAGRRWSPALLILCAFGLLWFEVLSLLLCLHHDQHPSFCLKPWAQINPFSLQLILASGQRKRSSERCMPLHEMEALVKHQVETLQLPPQSCPSPSIRFPQPRPTTPSVATVCIYRWSIKPQARIQSFFAVLWLKVIYNWNLSPEKSTLY